MPVHKASMELLVRLEERDVPCPLCVQGLNSHLALRSDDTQPGDFGVSPSCFRLPSPVCDGCRELRFNSF